MATVVPFIARFRQSVDWTAVERAGLDQLADRYAAAGLKVEVVFGATDAGDPWCVVQDEAGEVLAHIARIGGRIVVHSVLTDRLSEGADLSAALSGDPGAAVGGALGGEIVSLGETQTLITLVAAGLELEGGGPSVAHAAAPALNDALLSPSEGASRNPPRVVGAHDLAAPEAASPELAADARPAASGTTTPTAEPPAAALQPEAPGFLQVLAPTATDPAAPPVAEFGHAVSAAPGPTVFLGSAGGDGVPGASAAQQLAGGAGHDTLQEGGGLETVIGGAGDDRIELAVGVTAIGGAGADTFVIGPQPALGDSETLIARILDFDAEEGDRLLTWRGEQVPVVLHGEAPRSAARAQLEGGLARLNVDLDGDGKPDGYLLIREHHGPRAEPDPRLLEVLALDHGLPLPGHSLAGSDPGV